MEYKKLIYRFQELGARKIIIKLNYDEKVTLKTTIKKEKYDYFVLITKINYNCYNIVLRKNNKNAISKTRVDYKEYEKCLEFIFINIKSEIWDN